MLTNFKTKLGALAVIAGALAFQYSSTAYAGSWCYEIHECLPVAMCEGYEDARAWCDMVNPYSYMCYTLYAWCGYFDCDPFSAIHCVYDFL